MKLIYIAGPYTGATPHDVDRNIINAREMAHEAMKKGWFPITPHMNTAGFERVAPEITEKFIVDGYLEILSRCDAVLMCPNWERSGGSVKEYHYAKEKGINVYESVQNLPDMR